MKKLVILIPLIGAVLGGFALHHHLMPCSGQPMTIGTTIDATVNAVSEAVTTKETQ